MDIKSLDGCFLIDYWDIEKIIVDEFGLPHESHPFCMLSSDDISILPLDDIKNDMIMLRPIRVIKYTDEQLQSDNTKAVWSIVTQYLIGEKDVEHNYIDYNEVTEVLMCMACTSGKIKEGEYYIRISW